MRLVDLHKRSIKAEIPQDNLVSEWKLEETTGSTFFDTAGTNNGTDANIPNLTVTGKVGNGFDWNLTYAASNVPYSSDFVFNDGTVNQPFTYCFWVYRTGGGSLVRFIENVNIIFIGTVQNLLRLEYRNNSNVQYAQIATNNDSRGQVASEVWTHLAFTFDVVSGSNVIKIYKNGTEINTTGNPQAAVRNNITPDLKIGGSSFSGPMDEIKFYKRALTPEEIIGIYNKESF